MQKNEKILIAVVVLLVLVVAVLAISIMGKNKTISEQQTKITAQQNEINTLKGGSAGQQGGSNLASGIGKAVGSVLDLFI